MTQDKWNNLLMGVVVYMFLSNITQNITIKDLQRRVAVLEQHR